jgi:ABC-type oligopeptide transport system substrate-binding subunit
MLDPIGIRVVPEEMSWLDLLEGRRDQRLGLFALSWTFDDGDAWTFLMASLHTRRGPNDTRSTNPGYSNATLDRLIEATQEARGLEQVRERYEAAFRLALKELPLIPLYQNYDLYAASSRVSFDPRIDGKLVAWDMRLLSGAQPR